MLNEMWSFVYHSLAVTSMCIPYHGINLLIQFFSLPDTRGSRPRAKDLKTQETQVLGDEWGFL